MYLSSFLHSKPLQWKRVTEYSNTKGTELVKLLASQLIDKKTRAFLPYVIWSAITISFNKTGIDQAIVHKSTHGITASDIFVYTQTIVLPLSMGEIVGSFVMGLLIDCCSKRVQFVTHAFIILSCICFTVVFVYINGNI